jgi:hypothetical protein
MMKGEKKMLSDMGLRFDGSTVSIEGITKFATACFTSASIGDIIAELRRSPVQEEPYALGDLGLDKMLPTFDETLWFKVQSDYGSVGPLEFRLREGRLLQVGCVLNFPNRLFTDPSKKAYRRAMALLVSGYGEGIPIPYPSGEARQFADAISHCYVARCWAAPHKAIILRVGDREMWDSFARSLGLM